MPVLTVIGGANGAGKSYFSDFFVASRLISVVPVNIDALEENVDRDRIPDDPMRYEKKLKVEIDKVFQKLCDEAIVNQKDFAFESNLRTDQLRGIGKFEAAGYSLNLIYIRLDSIAQSKQRVQIRVSEGGHPVGDDSIKHNFEEGLKNLDLSVSENHWNRVFIIDNSRDMKSKGDSLSLLLAIDNANIVSISDQFFSNERERLLPQICRLIKKQII